MAEKSQQIHETNKMI